ncbi:MAG: deoxyribodipyrimidine photo-lyase [Hyphomicrobiaceae bacterium]|nr:deoxyribodipyrimidine photo-lyase [Hyphomicrobiaceae bacterium]
MGDRPVILWLRQDLRLADHPALAAAVATGRPVVPVYLLDDDSPGRWRPGGASRWWLGTSLPRLAASLERLGSRLIVRRGPADAVMPQIAEEVGASAIHVTRMIEPWAADVDRTLKASLAGSGIELKRFGGAHLFEPETILSQSGAPFRVYSAFARAAMAAPTPRRPVGAPSRLSAPQRWPESLDMASLGLLPCHPDWAGGLREAWSPGEAGASDRLSAFLGGPVARYRADRDRPDLMGTSRLSPHLHFGEISPHMCWHAARNRAASGEEGGSGVDKFCSELLWREFSAYLLHHWPNLPEVPFRPEFEDFPWQSDPEVLAAWQKGLTGYPVVDAGMRELWQTGYMHNRVRMIAASFLVKDLLVPWQAGQSWFWDTLVDADLANNAASWQWVAGSGADAAPYFRIFNPVKQGRTFDPEGTYVRRFVPELAKLPAEHIHAPFEAPPSVLEQAGVRLGQTYPAPIVAHPAARRRALEAFAAIRIKA